MTNAVLQSNAHEGLNENLVNFENGKVDETTEQKQGRRRRYYYYFFWR